MALSKLSVRTVLGGAEFVNWGRAKTILIVLFLLADLFLFVVLLQTKQNVQRISHQTISELVTVLNERGIQVQAEQIPVRRMQNQSVIMRNFVVDPMETAALILGSDVVTVESNPEQHLYHFESPSGKLFIQNNGFLFESRKESEPYQSGKIPGEESVISHITTLLHRKGIKRGTAEVISLTQENGVFSCVLRPVFSKYSIYGVNMQLQFDSQDIIRMEGHWFVGQEAEKADQNALLDITTILAGLLFDENQAPLEITEIRQGYYAADAFLNSREIAAVPVYTITDSVGNQRLFDGRTGTVIE